MHCFWWEVWYHSFLCSTVGNGFCLWLLLRLSLYPCFSTSWFLWALVWLSCFIWSLLSALDLCICSFHQICKNAGHYFTIYFLFHLLLLNRSFLGLCSDFTCYADEYSAKDSKEFLCWSLSFLSVQLPQLWYFASPWPPCLSTCLSTLLSSVWILFLCTVLWKFFLGCELVQG